MTRLVKRCEAAEKMFDKCSGGMSEEATTGEANKDPSKAQLWDRLLKASKIEQNKWWDLTTLQKYIDVGRIPRGLRIFITPTFNDPDPELVTEWAENSHGCSIVMLTLLVKYARKECDRQSGIIEDITKQLKNLCGQEEFTSDMEKLESKLDKIESEIKAKKQRKFQRALVDYERSQILTFAHRYDQLRSKSVTDKRITSSKSSE